MPSMPAVLSVARFLRGAIQGVFLVGFLTGLHHLGASSLFLGSLLSAAMATDFLLTLILGRASDRQHPRVLLVAGEGVAALSALLFLLVPSYWAMGLATLAAGIGQRSNGSPGPYAPAEQVLLARDIEASSRFPRLSHNLSSGLFGMAAGALLGAFSSLPEALSGFKGPMLALFLLSGLNGLLILRAPFSFRIPRRISRGEPIHFSRTERINIGLMILGNLFGGLSIGLVDPQIAYWLHLKFHAGIRETGLLLAAAFLFSAVLAYFFTVRLSVGALLKSVLALQVLSLLALLCLPLAPSLLPALLLYALRFGALRAPGGVRQALAGLLVSPNHTGLASGLHLSSLALSQSAGPLIAGALWEWHMTNGPVFLAALSAALSLAIFSFLMRAVDASSPVPGEEHSVF